MSKRQVNHELNEQITKPTQRPQYLETVRYWEWDCSVKFLIIAIFRHNSSQSDNFKQLLCNYYTPRRNQNRQCPILGMGLFGNAPDNPTEFITIQHNPTFPASP